MPPFFNLQKKSRQDKILLVLRTALKGCQDTAAINMSVCGDPLKKISGETIFIHSVPCGHTD